MERADPDVDIRHVAGQPQLHLVGGLVGERQRKNLLGRNALMQKIHDPAGHHTGFSAARPGEHQHRPIDVQHGLALRLSQRF